MSTHRSITRGLVLRLALIFLLAPILAGVNIMIVGEQDTDPRINSALEQKADAILPFVQFDAHGHPFLNDAVLGSKPDFTGLRVAIYYLGHDPVGVWPADLQLRSWDFFDGYQTVRRVHGKPLRFLFAPPAHSWTAWLHWYTDEITDEILPFVVVLMLITLPLTMMSVRRSLVPVERLSEEAARIEPGDEHARLSEADVPRELLPLVTAVNSGLERLDAGFASQRRFSAVVAHELRTPLSVLLLQLERELPPAQVVKARRQLLRLSRLIDQLLTISELTAKRIKLEGDVDLVAVSREAVAQEVPTALDAEMRIELHAPEAPVFVRGNATAIVAALRNLMDNAIRHSNRGGLLNVTVTPDAAIEVADNGPGIPAEDRATIFEPFWRNVKSKGSGLGLAIVHAMADLHSAVVSLKDNKPHGCIFRIEFPATGNGSGLQRESLGQDYADGHIRAAAGKALAPV